MRTSEVTLYYIPQRDHNLVQGNCVDRFLTRFSNRIFCKVKYGPIISLSHTEINSSLIKIVLIKDVLGSKHPQDVLEKWIKKRKNRTDIFHIMIFKWFYFVFISNDVFFKLRNKPIINGLKYRSIIWHGSSFMLNAKWQY